MIGISENYWENLIGVLLAFSLLALTIERALYQIFDSKLWGLIEKKVDEQAGGDFLDLKPWVSVAISVTITLRLQVDFIAVVLEREEVDFLSMVLTGLFLAGGSTGIYKFLKRARRSKTPLRTRSYRLRWPASSQHKRFAEGPWGNALEHRLSTHHRRRHLHRL